MSQTIFDILHELRQSALSERDKGDKFERLFAAYLRTDPQYKDKYSDVWLWMEWPDRVGADTGIDIVAKERDGSGYCAIQCKFYDSGHILSKSDIDSFFTASGKKPFTTRMIVHTGKDWGPNAHEALTSQYIPTAPPSLEFQISKIALLIGVSSASKTHRLSTLNRKSITLTSGRGIRCSCGGFR